MDISLKKFTDFLEKKVKFWDHSSDVHIPWTHVVVKYFSVELVLAQADKLRLAGLYASDPKGPRGPI